MFSFSISDRMKKNCMRTTATQTDRSRNSAHITSPNSGSNPLQKSRQMSNYPQKVSDKFHSKFEFQISNYSPLIEDRIDSKSLNARAELQILNRL